VEPSPYQRDIIHAVKTTEDNLIIQACAGSGKTTTLRILCDHFPVNLKVIAVCFAKVNREDFQKKLPRRIEASTMHSLGYKMVRENIRRLTQKHGKVTVDEKKQQRWLDKIFGNRYSRDEDEEELVQLVSKVSPLLRANCYDPENLDHVTAVLDNYFPSVELENVTIDQISAGCTTFLKALREEVHIIDFDDMLDFVTHFKLTGKKYDVILGDEVQDWTPQQAEFIRLMAGEPEPAGPVDPMAELMAASGLEVEAPTGTPTRNTRTRLILVGDEFQAIYGFRGADTNSMANLKAQFGCVEMPLSVCYRCPVSVVEQAQKIIGEEFIQSFDGAPEGTVLHRARSDYIDSITGLPDGAMVVCRTNAPLVPAAMALIKQHRKAVVRGRDIGSGLRTIVKNCDGMVDKKDAYSELVEQQGRLTTLLQAVYDWAEAKIEKFIEKDALTAAQYIEDQFSCILAVAQDCATVEELSATIEDIFSDDEEGVILSSAHRSKGLEAAYVMVLAPEMMPHPVALKYGSDEQIAQERNLKYVAYTRAMETLVLQPGKKDTGSEFPALQAKLEAKRYAEDLDE
jgi:DNA helicase-2/ATP-dependent DNA helicase PcrA